MKDIANTSDIINDDNLILFFISYHDPLVRFYDFFLHHINIIKRFHEMIKNC
jgi:hypothetical protein